MRCQISTAKTLGLLFLGIIMLGASWFCTTLSQPNAHIAGWAGLVFFGLCLLAILAQLFRKGPGVIIDEKGIQDLRSFGLISWADIVSLRIGEMKSRRFLCIEVSNTDVYLSRISAYKRMLAKANASLGFPPITISFSALSPGLEEVWQYLQAKHHDKIAAHR